MKFFLPNISNQETSENIYKHFKEKNSKTFRDILNDRILSIEGISHNGETFKYTIGENGKYSDGIVYVIFKTKINYLVCSAKRGGISSIELPLIFGLKEVDTCVTFDNLS